MTPQERAEKIRLAWNDACLEKGANVFSPWGIEKLDEICAAQIEEAEREAFKSGCNTHLATCADQFRKGFKAAQKKAATITQKRYLKGQQARRKHAVR